MKLAILGGSHLQKDLVLRAVEMGHEAHVIAWREGEMVSKICHEFHEVSLTEVDLIVDLCRSLEIDGVVSTSSDLAVPAWAAVADELRLVGPSRRTALNCTHKGEMRSVLASAGCSVPRFERYSEMPGTPPFEFPFMVKASDRSGSRGVRKVRNHEEWVLAFREAAVVSFSGDVVVEECFEGKQFSVEMISQHGTHFFCGLTEEFFDSKALCEKGNLVPGRISNKDMVEVIRVTRKGLSALGVRHGASHSEVRVNEKGECCIIEIGARMGGDFRNRLVKQAYGVDMDELVIRIALGKESELKDAVPTSQAMISWVFNQQDSIIMDAVSSESFCTHQEHLIPLGVGVPKSSNQRFAYAIVSGAAEAGRNWIERELKRNEWL